MCVHATQNRQTSLLLIDAVVLFVFPCIFSLLNTQPKRLRQENGPEYSIERPQVQGTTKCAFLPSEWWYARSASMYFVRPAIRIAGTKIAQLVMYHISTWGDANLLVLLCALYANKYVLFWMTLLFWSREYSTTVHASFSVSPIWK
jgi:hypothetical protein